MSKGQEGCQECGVGEECRSGLAVTRTRVLGRVILECSSVLLAASMGDVDPFAIHSRRILNLF
jgi:hypothetical protein